MNKQKQKQNPAAEAVTTDVSKYATHRSDNRARGSRIIPRRELFFFLFNHTRTVRLGRPVKWSHGNIEQVRFFDMMGCAPAFNYYTRIKYPT